MMKNTVRAICALLLLPATVVLAGTGKETKKVETVEEKSWISGDLGVTVVTKYLSRGVTLENQGLITQPYADIYFKLFESESGFINKVSLNLGIWSSIHSEHTDAGVATGSGSSTTRSWYEFDYTVGLATTFAKNFTFTPSFFAFLSPNDGFSTFYGLNMSLSYNDSDWWGGKFALNPSVTVLAELENKAGTGADEGFYYEVALNPTKAFGPVSVSLPIKAGFGSNDFYGSLASNGTVQDEAFGYASAGLLVSYGLSFIPAKYGAWTVSAGATFLYHGEGTEDFNTRERGGNVSNGDNHDWIFNAGVSVAF
jgi:hypothetical protein